MPKKLNRANKQISKNIIILYIQIVSAPGKKFLTN
jgi:hypothetical protein